MPHPDQDQGEGDGRQQICALTSNGTRATGLRTNNGILAQVQGDRVQSHPHPPASTTSLPARYCVDPRPVPLWQARGVWMFNFLIANWPLKRPRFFQSLRSSPNQDRSGTQQNPLSYWSRLFGNRPGTPDPHHKIDGSLRASESRESSCSPDFVDVLGSTQVPTDGDSGVIPLGSNIAPPRERDTEHGEAADRHDNHVPPVDRRTDPTVDDHKSALEKQQREVQYMLKRVSELNSTRGLLFGHFENLVRSLDRLTQQVTEFTHSLDLPDPLATKLEDFQHEVEILRFDEFASLEANISRYGDRENDIMQSLLRAHRSLDKVLRSNSVVLSRDQSPHQTPISSTPAVDIGDGFGQSPGEIQYRLKMGDVDLIKEQLADFYSERAQLLGEQQARTQVGLSLDDNSLEFLRSFDQQVEVLHDQLELEELFAEALERLVHDKYALQVSNEASLRGPSEESGAFSSAENSALTYPLTGRSIEQGKESALCGNLKDRNIKYVDHLRGPHTSPVDPANFLNVWLLDSTRHQPLVANDFALLLEASQVDATSLKDLERAFLDHWFTDFSELDFAHHRTMADQLSMGTDSQDAQLGSETAAAAQPTSFPLLQLGPSTRTEDIIAQAMRARGISHPEASAT